MPLSLCSAHRGSNLGQIFDVMKIRIPEEVFPGPYEAAADDDQDGSDPKHLTAQCPGQQYQSHARKKAADSHESQRRAGDIPLDFAESLPSLGSYILICAHLALIQLT